VGVTRRQSRWRNLRDERVWTFSSEFGVEYAPSRGDLRGARRVWVLGRWKDWR
jgi:hypothetical protein